MSEVRQKLLERVTAFIDRSQELTISAPVDTGYFTVEPEVVSGVLDLLLETAELLRDIGAYFDEQIDSPQVEEITAEDDAGFLREIGASISTELAARELADLAVMGCSEILDIHRELQVAVKEQNFWKIVAHGDAGLGRTARALIPIESAMREYEGLPAMRRRWANLEDSLEIRRQYGMLWRAAERAGNPGGEALRTAIRKIGQRIAILRRLDIYPFLRIDDRLTIRKLQKRVLSFLEGGDGEDKGRRLWEDLVAFFGLLKQVNQRHELREHDRQLVLTVHYELAHKLKSERVPTAVLERLEPLLGCDDELDTVLLRPQDHSRRDFLGPLERLKEELFQAESPAPVIL